MGNEVCCHVPTSSQNKQQVYEISSKVIVIDSQTKPSQPHSQKHQTIPSPVIISLPQLCHAVQQVYDREKPFEKQLNQQSSNQTVQFGSDFYFGMLDQTRRPTKFGKMYKTNGALFIGMFVGGVANGPCFFIMKDGSYYRGNMKNNTADCEDNGQFVTQSLHYVGGFKNNQFDGKGKEKVAPKKYSFEGVYESGRKVEGLMKWHENGQQHEFIGKFNQNGQFHGKGRYTDPEGTFQGEFVKGQKHGFGIYYYKSRLRYQGYYEHNQKQGEGKIVNFDGTIAYRGMFENGMPHGKGVATSKNGQEFEAHWEHGIDKRHLQ